MKAIAYLTTLSVLTSLSAAATDLRFTSGSVSTNFSSVLLTLAGPSNLVCQIERLNPTNDVWESQGTVNLGATGSAAFNSSLLSGYGFFRTKATNNSYFSTNAYGAVTALLGEGTSFIGNPFGPTRLTNIFPNPVEGMAADKYVNGPGWSVSDYFFGAWTVNHSVGTLEALYVDVPAGSNVQFIVNGLFDTNAISISIPTGYSTWCLPLYHLNPTNTWFVDMFDTNHVGGVSAMPVQTPGFDPQAWAYQMIDNAGHYSTNQLGTNNVWMHHGTNVVIHFEIAEGFFISKPTNATWTATRPIW